MFFIFYFSPVNMLFKCCEVGHLDRSLQGLGLLWSRPPPEELLFLPTCALASFFMLFALTVISEEVQRIVQNVLHQTKSK